MKDTDGETCPGHDHRATKKTTTRERNVSLRRYDEYNTGVESSWNLFEEKNERFRKF